LIVQSAPSKHNTPSDKIDYCVVGAHLHLFTAPTNFTIVAPSTTPFILCLDGSQQISSNKLFNTQHITLGYQRALPCIVLLSPLVLRLMLCQNEAMACDIVYSDVPAIDDSSTVAVIFVGMDTQVTDVNGIKTDNQRVNTPEDVIIAHGAPPHKLISDSAKVIISNKIHNILCTHCIQSWQSEPHQQQQNPAEHRFKTFKCATNWVLYCSGAPDYTWLLCLQYVCYLLNHAYHENHAGVPLQVLTGSTVDISPLLCFHFWQKVYFIIVDSSFPSNSMEVVGNIVGISEHCGHALTYKVLNPKILKVVYQSSFHPVVSDDINVRAELLDGEKTDVIQSHDNIDSHLTNPKHLTTSSPTPIVDPNNLVGLTFLHNRALVLLK
jgi:hypothetical protein